MLDLMHRHRRGACWTLAGIAAAAAGPAHASFLAGEALDTAADVLAWVILVLVPVGGIVIFWMVHVLPEKIAHKRHHPQTKAIQVLCLLSLVFGGLLWPIAWLWAYTRPVGFKAAYGTDKHEDYFTERLAQWREGKLSPHERAHLEDELAAMASRAALPAELRQLRDELASQPSTAAPAASAPGIPAAANEAA